MEILRSIFYLTGQGFSKYLLYVLFLYKSEKYILAYFQCG